MKDSNTHTVRPAGRQPTPRRSPAHDPARPPVEAAGAQATVTNPRRLVRVVVAHPDALAPWGPAPARIAVVAIAEAKADAGGEEREPVEPVVAEREPMAGEERAGANSAEAADPTAAEAAEAAAHGVHTAAHAAAGATTPAAKGSCRGKVWYRQRCRQDGRNKRDLTQHVTPP